MANHPFNLVLLLSATFLLNLSLVSAQTQDFVYSFCGNTGNFTNTSTYSTNRNLLLSSLSSNISTSSERLFRNVTTGQNPDRIYGLYLCRGDNTPQFCQACVQAARDSAAQICPNQMEAIIYYERCMLRYSNRSIVGVMQNDPPLFLYNTGNITDRNGFNRALGNLLLEVQGRASSGNKYATGEANFTTFQRIYALMQCTLDLSPTACNMCLEAARGYIPTCCDGRIGARVILPSCNLRYEIRPFYDASFSPRPPPPPRPPSPPPNSTSTQPEGNGKRSSRTIIAIVIPVAIALILFFIGVVCMCMRMRKRKTKQAIDYEDDITTLESLQFDFATVRAATDNFSDANKLGEGGFGAVYKGKLSDGQEIAVKRLSRNSGQGTEQFKNEVVLMAKLQHRNLVRLFGYSFEGEEKLLIYEFVPNSSLDRFIFDPIKRAELDWERRYNIIGGIARGLLYLHEDSRHRIIHRDLKAGNVLLDTEMNPKISDFGMARLVVLDETHANTNRVVGTYGYMSPEYAMHGQFSVKSDVYSFGVLLLEIVSGQRINTFHQSEQAEDLLSYAWRCWKDGTALQLLDPTLRGSCSASEVVRCIHIGLLCVQEDAADRPNMATVVLMLTSYSITLVLPSKPAFFISSKADPVFPAIMEESCSTETNRAMANSTPWSVNEVSITEVEPR